MSNKGKVSADRLLEALAPQLSAEFDHILDEFRGTLEAEATVRLRKALLDKEAEFRTRSTEAEQRTREETTQAVRAEVVAELESRFNDRLAGEVDGLKQSFQQQEREAQERWKQERIDLIAEAEKWRSLANFHRRVGEAGSQSEILRRFLAAADGFSKGVAVYLNKPDGFALWNAQGEAAFPDVVSEDTIDPDWFFTEIVVRSQTVAAVCAVGVAEGDDFSVIVDALKRAIENFGLRLRFFGRGGRPESDEMNNPLEPSEAGEDNGGDPGVDARRLARTLVSEIKLGHEREVVEGRRHADLYSRLKKEIDASRESYRRQVIDSGSDYFHRELVKILADNDPARLGDNYPGPPRG